MVFNSFTYDGINSLNSGIYITGEAVFNAPERVVEMVSVPGRNGALAIDQGRFENIEVSYPAGAFGATMSDFADKITDFRNILASRYTYKRLADTYHPDEFRLGLYKSGLEVNAVRYNTAGEFNIVFDCKPQRFLTTGETETTFTSNGTITNPTAFASNPLLIVTGAGNLTIGGQAMTIVNGSGSSQVIYIDCESQEAWEIVGGSKVSRNDYIQNAGETFPVLSAGSNSVVLGTGITKVKITPRWWRI